jgi:hypothetical protein
MFDFSAAFTPLTSSHTTATFITVLRRVHKHNGFDFLVSEYGMTAVLLAS